MPSGAAITNLFRTSESGVVKELWEQKIEPHPENLLPFSTEGFEEHLLRMRSRDYALLGLMLDFEMRISRLKPCDLAIGKERFFAGHLAYPTYKGFPYLHMFQKR